MLSGLKVTGLLGFTVPGRAFRCYAASFLRATIFSSITKIIYTGVMRLGPRKPRKQETGPRKPYAPRAGADPRARRESVYLTLPSALVADLRERWPTVAGGAVRAVLESFYGATPARAPLVPFGGRYVPESPARLCIRLDRAWRLWADQHKVSLSSVVADALIRRWYLGE